MGLFSNKISRDKLKEGDHIYSWRRLKTYAHHGIYVGDGRVIHYTRPTGSLFDKIISSSSNHGCIRCCGGETMDGGVISTCLDCFLAGRKLYLYEYNASEGTFLAKRGGTCIPEPSDPPEAVIHRANFLLQCNGFGVYDLIENNCEHFALYCKTGLVLTIPNGVRCGQTAVVAAAGISAKDLPRAMLYSQQQFIGAGASGGGLAAGLGAVAALGGMAMYYVSYMNLYNDTRKKLEKMSVERFYFLICRRNMHAY